MLSRFPNSRPGGGLNAFSLRVLSLRALSRGLVSQSLLSVSLLSLSLLSLSGCTKCTTYKPDANDQAVEDAGETGDSASPGADNPDDAPDAPRVETKDLITGKGREAAVGVTVEVHYVGTFENGEQFDSSRDRKKPFSFEIGSGKVIRGWDVGVVGMRVGGKRVLKIPPEFAYKSRGVPGVIPPDTPLVFEIELLSIKP